jgi:hydrogenase maturation protein HypF
MAENQIREKVIGVAFDGTGYGDDKAIWGGEFLITDMKDYHREAHFDYVLMPGGEMAIKQPWRMALSYLYNFYGEDFLNLDLELVKRIDQKMCKTIKKILDKKINVFPTSSAGRLFDCVSVLLNWRENTNYEGQPAVELEFLADENINSSYDFEMIKERGKFIIHPELMIKGVVGDLIEQEKKSTISAKFHNTMAQVINQVCLKLRGEHNLNDVCLSGGVFQNMFLLEGAFELLTRNGFKVYTHNKIPPNDGGISLGQAAVANQRI